MLNVSKLSASYGAIQAVRAIDVSVRPGQFTVLLGANGAGKSTTLRSIAGLHRPVTGSSGSATRKSPALPLHNVVRSGLALVPEGRMVVAPLTVEENLALSRFLRPKRRIPISSTASTSLFPRLKERRQQTAGLMSGGEQQMLAIGRALMTKPQMLVLDEPSMGLAPAIVDLVFEAIVPCTSRASRFCSSSRMLRLRCPSATTAM